MFSLPDEPPRGRAIKKAFTKALRAAFIATFLLLGTRPEAKADEILVSAAISLTEALKEIGKAYSSANPKTKIAFNFGSSGTLQQQIEQGAPVDVFVSAGGKEMDALQKANLIEAAARVNFAGNRLVLIAPAASKIKSWDDLKSPAVKHIALSQPASVPSGRYAKETLTKRGLWSAVQPKAVFGENVRQTLAYIVNGDADAGFVFLTDARTTGNKVRIVQEAIPGKDHAPIIYSAAAVSGGANPLGARRFAQFLLSPAAQSILARHGFASLRPSAAKRKPK